MPDRRIMVMVMRQKEKKGEAKKRKYTQKVTPKRRNQS